MPQSQDTAAWYKLYKFVCNLPGLLHEEVLQQLLLVHLAHGIARQRFHKLYALWHLQKAELILYH